MCKLSRDYLNNLIAKSGIKVGTAKATAVAAIIELIDENSLDGLIKSIRSDYDDMRQILGKKNDLLAECRQLCLEVNDASRQLEDIRSKIQVEKDALQKLREQVREEEFDASIAGCSDGEKSRILAYKAAIDIGKRQFFGRITDDDIKQILRSASNVAANWIRPTTGADNQTT